MSSQSKILFVLTSDNQELYPGKTAGWYLPELAHPYHVLSPHFSITIASPKGGEAPLDPSSVEATKEDPISVDFLKTKEALWKNTVTLQSLIGHAGEFEAILFVGGHGPMFDLAALPVSHALINEFYAHSKIISAVCHGPAAIAKVKLPDGQYLLHDIPVTGFSNTEEDVVKLTSAVPFSLEDQLKEASGGKYEKTSDWGVKVLVSKRDGRVFVTGQNPASATGVGEAVLEALRK